MSLVKTLLLGVLGISFILVGCDKKPGRPVPAQLPSTTGQSAKSDSNDIFNEFYSDSAEASDKEKNTGTFSPNQAKKQATAATAKADANDSYTPVFSDNGRYVVQIATMASRWLADELAAEMKEKGYPSYVIEVQDPAPNLTGTYYRVRIGGFNTSVEAKAFGENVLRPANFDYWVDRKANESASAAPV